MPDVFTVSAPAATPLGGGGEVLSKLYADSRTVVFFPLSERDEIRPSDRMGIVGDLDGDAELERASATPGTVGLARAFELGVGLVGQGAIADALTRDLTMEAVVRLDTDEPGSYTVLVRGKGSSAAESQLYGLRMIVSEGPVFELEAFGEDATGEPLEIPAVEIATPSGWCYLAVTRRWVSATECRYRYHVNGHLVAEVEGASGLIEGGIDGTLLVGVGTDEAGYAAHWVGAIDAVRFSEEVRSSEEIFQIWQRLAVHPARCYGLLCALQPVGRVWSQEPDSVAQRWLANEAVALAAAVELAEGLRSDYLPHRAWATLPEWEQAIGLTHGRGEDLDTRRTRVLSHLSSDPGYAVEAIQTALGRLVGYAPEDVEIVEYDCEYRAAFAEESDVPAWLQVLAGGGDAAVTDEDLELSGDATADLRWEADAALRVRQPLDFDARLGASAQDGAELAVYLSSWSLLDAYAGIYVRNAAGELVVWGVRGHPGGGGGELLAWRRYAEGAWTAWTTIEEDPAAGWIRLRVASATELELSWSDGELVETAEHVTAIAGVDAPVELGVVLGSTAASRSEDIYARLTEWRAYMPQSTRVWYWYAYLDPELGPARDVAGARVLAARRTPAHARGAITEARQALCDEGAGCDTEPLQGA